MMGQRRPWKGTICLTISANMVIAYSLNQRFYYPHWEEAHWEKEILMAEWNRVWKNGTFGEEMKQKVRLISLRIYIRYKSKPKTIINIGK